MGIESPELRQPVSGIPVTQAATEFNTSLWARIKAYVALTKPRIIELLLITTIPTMFLAARGMPGWWLLIATLVGGALAAGSANSFNCYVDRDIDVHMNRTRNRPLVTGEITPRAALIFSFAIGAVSLLWLGFFVNIMSAFLALLAIVIYVVGYTILLKRSTPQNIVWGGIAGALPVLIGWSAVTGTISWAALAFLLVVFFWTPPHYWPLSIKFKNDYARAGVPMLPVVANQVTVSRQIIWYGLAMVLSALAIGPLAYMTPVYYGGCAALGAWFMYLCVQLHRTTVGTAKRKIKPMKVFHASITYLTLLSVLITVDPFIPL